MPKQPKNNYENRTQYFEELFKNKCEKIIERGDVIQKNTDELFKNKKIEYGLVTYSADTMSMVDRTLVNISRLIEIGKQSTFIITYGKHRDEPMRFYPGELEIPKRLGNLASQAKKKYLVIYADTDAKIFKAKQLLGEYVKNKN
jgi:hypothetical protein